MARGQPPSAFYKNKNPPPRRDCCRQFKIGLPILECVVAPQVGSTRMKQTVLCRQPPSGLQPPELCRTRSVGGKKLWIWVPVKGRFILQPCHTLLLRSNGRPSGERCVSAALALDTDPHLCSDSNLSLHKGPGTADHRPIVG